MAVAYFVFVIHQRSHFSCLDVLHCSWGMYGFLKQGPFNEVPLTKLWTEVWRWQRLAAAQIHVTLLPLNVYFNA